MLGLKTLEPVETLELIHDVDEALVDLLSSLPDEDWLRPAVGEWRVRDVAAHLLDGNLRRLSLARDGLTPPAADEPVRNYQSLIGFLNQLNADWTKAARRLSPRVITDLLRFSNPQVQDYFRSLDPQGPAPFPVSWAGENASQAWFDIAREYTEKWHHQQQIRDAVDAPGLTESRYVAPLLDIFMRALPRAYADVEGEPGAIIVLVVTDLRNGQWTLLREEGAWNLYTGAPKDHAPSASVRIEADDAWRLLVKGLQPGEARSRAELSGARRLTDPFFEACAVMA